MRDPLVLGYHAIGDGWNVPLAVAPRDLERQVRALLRLGYVPARFGDAVLAPRGEKTFVITFDDAFRSVADRALPVLEALGVPATLFVPTGWIGDLHPLADWPQMRQWSRPGLEAELELMGWTEIRELRARGWEIGSHAHSHPFLTRLDDAAVADELSRSRAILAEQLGAPPSTLAYPYGDVDERVSTAAAAAGYSAAAALMTAPEYLRRESHPLRVRRLGVFAVDGRARFAAKLALMAATAAPRGARRPASPRPAVRAEPSGRRATARVAVIVPCFNDGPLAAEAVASVVEDEPVELVVIDDCSTDAQTAAALDDLRAAGVHVVRHAANRGLCGARNTGLEHTTAPLVFALDADDLLEPGALRRLADRLDDAPGVAAAYGDLQEFGTRARVLGMPAELDAFRVAFRNDYPVCALFRREVLDAVGGWRDVGGMVGYEDWSLWMTLAERGERAIHAGPGFVAVRRRLHGPRMLGDSATRHRRLYAALRDSHPRLFAQLGAHRRASTLSRPLRLAYPLLFGARPPLGLRTTWWALTARVGRALRP